MSAWLAVDADLDLAVRPLPRFHSGRLAAQAEQNGNDPPGEPGRPGTLGGSREQYIGLLTGS